SPRRWMRITAPGRMVDAGNRRVHIHVQGAGSPVVVLEAGIAASSLSWALVQPLLAEFATVVSYDRAGLGWSDRSDGTPTALGSAHDLALMLERSGLPAP